MKCLFIETNRLFITVFHPDMAIFVHRNSLDDDCRKFIPDEVFETEEDARKTVAFLMESYGNPEKPQVYPILLKSGENIGYVQAVPLGNGDFEIGYHIASGFTKKGYATEAVGAFVPQIMALLGKDVLYGICRADNAASCRVLEKCSFKLFDKTLCESKGEQHLVCKYLFSAARTE